MKLKIISGAQTGVDIAALEVAKELCLETGGLMPKGWLTEDGPRPEYEALYGMKEHPSPNYALRTVANVFNSHGTLILKPTYDFNSPGTRATQYHCKVHSKRYLILPLSGWDRHQSREHVFDIWMSAYTDYPRQYIMPNDTVTLNVAGPRESKFPGIREQAKELLTDLFQKFLPDGKKTS